MRHLIAILAASIALSTGIGFAAAKLSEPDPVRAADPEKAVVTELKKLNGAIGKGPGDFNSVLYFLRKIDAATYTTCQAVNDSTVFECAPGN